MHAENEYIQTVYTQMRRRKTRLMTRPSFSDKSSKGAYEEMIQASSQILSKLDLERLILVLRTRFVHITSIIHHNSDRFFPYLVQMCTQMRFCVYVATSLPKLCLYSTHFSINAVPVINFKMAAIVAETGK